METYQFSITTLECDAFFEIPCDAFRALFQIENLKERMRKLRELSTPISIHSTGDLYFTIVDNGTTDSEESWEEAEWEVFPEDH